MTAQGEAEQVWKMIEKQPIAMLTTEEEGRLVSRPMYSVSRPNEERIYFITPLDSGKVHEIGGRAPVNLGYSNPAKNDYLSIAGTASTSQNREKLRELWSFFSEAWLPQGPDGADVALIEVIPDEAKLWDSTSSKLIQGFRMLKAVATQDPPEGGETRRVSM